MLKTIPQEFKSSENVIERIVYAVNQQMSETLTDSASDISKHGINGGFSGFVYYSDTCKFYQENKSDIWELLIDQSEEMGYKNPFEMLAIFGGAGNVGGVDQFENLMSWYAAEEAARFVVDFEEVEEEE